MGVESGIRLGMYLGCRRACFYGRPDITPPPSGTPTLMTIHARLHRYANSQPQPLGRTPTLTHPPPSNPPTPIHPNPPPPSLTHPRPPDPHPPPRTHPHARTHMAAVRSFTGVGVKLPGASASELTSGRSAVLRASSRRDGVHRQTKPMATVATPDLGAI